MARRLYRFNAANSARPWNAPRTEYVNTPAQRSWGNWVGFDTSRAAAENDRIQLLVWLPGSPVLRT